MGHHSQQDPAGSAGPDLTYLLNLAAQGDPEAARQVMPHIYAELRRIAEAKRQAIGPRGTLTSTVLVHEAYLRILRNSPEGWGARSHFFFAAARAMRDILVEDARRRMTAKHGSGLNRIRLEEAGISIDALPEDVLGLNRCLERLASQDELGSNIVLLRYFIGLSTPEIAEILRVSVRSIERKWTFLRVWLASELTGN